MQSYEQKQSAFWWTRDIRTTVYFIRELTGVFIAFYVMYFIAYGFFDSYRTFATHTASNVISWISLGAALIHTVTWFWVTVKISPVPLSKILQMLAFLGLIAAWIGVSYYLFSFFYVCHSC